MVPDQSFSSSDWVRDPVGAEQCVFRRWDNPDNITDWRVLKDDAQCGVNIDGWKYCPQRKGDAQYINFLTKLKGVLLADLDCHTTS